MELAEAISEAEVKAWQSLARHKFQMFGYWASILVHLRKIAGVRGSSPFRDLVTLARHRSYTPQK